ncbi:MAG: family 43 glycosylhydrolase [Microbacteriaceae bacterium]
MAATYSNPIARDGDFADPFVLRHDGRYYLYCTNPDVRCWSSNDLLTWRLEGATIEEDAFPGLVPFAPEVVYADGAFYMYTSPSGHGHFVLRADSPTGPFSPVSGNVGHAIDGNVLIDDDGRWYFYWAGDEGIWGCEMSSPTDFGEPVLTGIHMNGWTEGPFVSKRDGVYYMTLTGNHYLSSGYRIDAASSDHPLTGWVPDPRNPILVAAEGPAVGLGHSSSVWGPDLVSTWLIYHNINPDASRDLDIDRQIWDGRRIEVLGPSTTAPAPAAPDAVGLDAMLTADAFTAELNLTADTPREHGVSVGELRVALPAGFAPGALHCWRLVYDHDTARVFIDGRLHLESQTVIPAASPITVFGDVVVGHCALTRTTPQAADRDAPRPPAAPAPDGKDAAFEDQAASGTGKRILADDRWGDFTLTATVSFSLDSPNSHADLLLRASQLSEGGEGDDARLGIDFLLGYSVQLHHDRVLLARHAYDQRILAEYAMPLDQTRPHAIRVRAEGATFTVDVDGDEVLRADDPHAYLVGRVGIRTDDCDLLVESLTMTKE